MVIKIFIRWIPSAVIITGLCGLVYTTVQQNYRQSLNDPQIQMAEDAAAQIVSGKQIDQVVPIEKVDIAQSLLPWLAVYDSSGMPLIFQGVLGGAPPKLPPGVFDTSAWNAPIIGHHFNTAPPNENRFTWQPEPGVRQAVVLVEFNTPNGKAFAAAGRNMREVENREGQLTGIVALAWLVLMGATAVWYALIFLIFRKKP